MPLHLLPPHLKLHILSSLHVPPTPTPTPPTQTSPQPDTETQNSTVPSSTSSAASSVSTSASTAPLFDLSSVTPSTPLPAPFTFATLSHLHTHNYCIIDSFLPPLTSTTTTTASQPLNTLQADIDHLLTTGAFSQGGMQATDSWKAASVRGDKVCWLSADRALPPSIAHLLGELHRAVGGLAGCVGGWPCVASSSQLALYEAGGRYVRHLDVRRGGVSGGPVRRLTAIVYLNDGWEADWGGQLRLYEPSGSEAGEGEASVDVLPVYGRLVLFASEEVEHEVLPATKRRVALTTWFK